jgi:hypothetical protein
MLVGRGVVEAVAQHAVIKLAVAHAIAPASYGRKALAKRKIRGKLGDYGQLWEAKYPPRPRGTWRRT